MDFSSGAGSGVMRATLNEGSGGGGQCWRGEDRHYGGSRKWTEVSNLKGKSAGGYAALLALISPQSTILTS